MKHNLILEICDSGSGLQKNIVLIQNLRHKMVSREPTNRARSKQVLQIPAQHLSCQMAVTVSKDASAGSANIVAVWQSPSVFQIQPFVHKGLRYPEREHKVNDMQLDSLSRVAGLKRLIARMEHPCHRQDPLRTSPTGHGAIDAMLGGGIVQGRLHEIFAIQPEDVSSAAGFATMLARQRGGAVIWVRQNRVNAQLCAEGLAEIGLDPARLLLCLAPDAAGVLKTANEAARCPHVATVIAELWRRVPELSLTASRRLALSAETSGAILLMLRVAADPEPSAASTRWSVASAPSNPLAANAPGLTAFDLTLLRQRGRAGEGQWRVVWERDHARFVDAQAQSAPLSGALCPVPALRPVGMADRRAA